MFRIFLITYHLKELSIVNLIAEFHQGLYLWSHSLSLNSPCSQFVVSSRITKSYSQRMSERMHLRTDHQFGISPIEKPLYRHNIAVKRLKFSTNPAVRRTNSASSFSLLFLYRLVRSAILIENQFIAFLSDTDLATLAKASM